MAQGLAAGAPKPADRGGRALPISHPDSTIFRTSRRRTPLMAQRVWLVWPLLYMAILSGLSAIPGPTPGQEPEGLATSLAWVPPTLQNGLHLPAYGLLAWLWFRGLNRHFALGSSLVVGVGLTAGFGLIDEWHQAFVPGRFPSATDVVADALGAGVAAGLYGYRHGSQPR